MKQITVAFIHDTLYALKMDYGTPGDIYQITSTEVNPETGVREQQRKRVSIDRIITLPTVLTSAFKYALSFIAANKNFTYGANYETGTRMLIVDGNDLPENFIIENNDYVVLEEEVGPVRYEIKNVERFELGYGYLLTVQQTAGSEPFQILEFSLSNRLFVKDRVKRE